MRSRGILLRRGKILYLTAHKPFQCVFAARRRNRVRGVTANGASAVPAGHAEQPTHPCCSAHQHHLLWLPLHSLLPCLWWLTIGIVTSRHSENVRGRILSLCVCVWEGRTPNTALSWAYSASGSCPYTTKREGPSLSPAERKNSSSGIRFQRNNKREPPLSLPFWNTFQASAWELPKETGVSIS